MTQSEKIKYDKIREKEDCAIKKKVLKRKKRNATEKSTKVKKENASLGLTFRKSFGNHNKKVKSQIPMMNEQMEG